MLAPLRWEGTFVPVLPGSLAAYVEAPTPYLMGASRALIDAQRFDLSTVLVVDTVTRTTSTISRAESGDVLMVQAALSTYAQASGAFCFTGGGDSPSWRQISSPEEMRRTPDGPEGVDSHHRTRRTP